MNYVLIDLSSEKDKLLALAARIDAHVTQNHNEELISITNKWGSGIIRYTNFSNGLSVISFNILFSKEVSLNLCNNLSAPSHFIYASEGNLSYQSSSINYKINRYQNIVIGATEKAVGYFTFPAQSKLKATFINVDVTEFYHKRKQLNHLVDYNFEKIFKISPRPYVHKGSYSLKIADELVKYWKIERESEHIQYLKVEGQILLILSLQLLAYKNQKNSSKNYEYLEEKDVEKIRDLTKFIEYNIGENITITALVKQSGIHAKKLQAGFQLLYNKSINEFIRELKLKIAINSLENTNESISEIVYKIGFKSRSYFSKIFLEQYGILPMEFKKKKNTKNNTN